MNARQLLDVREMTRTQEWKVFEKRVKEVADEFKSAALSPVEETRDIYAGERAKGAHSALESLLPDFLSWLDSEIKNQPVE